ncbi:helix-turn-helix transcriptional regulator [Herbiconiux ginsengi]|uniref:Regulatory protein, luxR family n=1 Tax=Herbiconiux ginsengi TaxID=381665 RepID=A0A1H3SQ35_9MICO|nr:LuxR C-terminal-related transcriptional regulator [Herbiconiux ginsengi]SDZ39830.1 regulatory protein, luxR family [Herbiconiux ginsengi]
MTAGSDRSNGDLERLFQAVEERQWDTVTEGLRSMWGELYDNRPAELLALFSAMPEEEFDKAPRLRIAQEHLRNKVEGKPFSRAYRDILGSDEAADPIDRLAALTGQLAVARANGRHFESVRIAETAREYLRSLPIDAIPKLSNALPEFHFHWGVTFEQAGRTEEAVDEYIESFDWATSIGSRMTMTSAAGALAYLRALAGQDREAAAWLEKIPAPPSEGWWSAFATTKALLADALIKVDRLDRAGARAVLDTIDIAQSVDDVGEYYFVSALVTSSSSDAQQLLAGMDQLLGDLPRGEMRSPATSEYLSVARYLLLTELGRTAGALRMMESEQLTADAPLIRQIAVGLHVRRLIAVGNHAAGRRLSDPLKHVANSRPRVLVRALLVSAETDKLGRYPELLERAVELAHYNRHYSAFRMVLPQTRLDAAALFHELGDTEVSMRLKAASEPVVMPGADSLTRRERRVVELALRGLSNPQIAEHLAVSVNTVKTQMRSAYGKLRVSSREQLMQQLQFEE